MSIQATNIKNASETDLRDFIHANLAKVSAFLFNTYAQSGEAFRDLNDDIQDNYLWAVSDLVEDVRLAWIELERRRGLADVEQLKAEIKPLAARAVAS